MVDVERYIHLQGRLTTHGAAESQNKGRDAALRICLLSCERNVDELRGTCAGWCCTGLMAGKALWGIIFGTTQETGLCMNGADGLALTLLFGADTQFRYLNKIKPCFFLWQLRLKQADGVGHAVCLDDWLVVLC